MYSHPFQGDRVRSLGFSRTIVAVKTVERQTIRLSGRRANKTAGRPGNQLHSRFRAPEMRVGLGDCPEFSGDYIKTCDTRCRRVDQRSVNEDDSSPRLQHPHESQAY